MQSSKNIQNSPSTSTVPDPLTIGRINVTTISDLTSVNGQPFTPGNVYDWATYPASANVNLSGNVLYTSTGNIQLSGATSVTGLLTVSGLTVSNVLTVNRNATVSNLLTTSGLAVNNNATVSNLLTTSGLTVSNLLTTSGLTVSNLLTTSGLAVNNNATVSNLLTTSGLAVNNNATVSNLLTTSGLAVNNNATVSNLLTTSGLVVNNNLSVGTINGFVYPYGYVLGTGIVRVDLCGNDASGASSKYVYPFSTLSAALMHAISGDEVLVNPGTYTQNTKLTIPTGVSIRGANTNSVVIRKVNATTSYTLFEMSSNTRLEDVTLILTSSSQLISNANYALIAMSGENILTGTLRSLVLTATCTNAGGNVYGVWATGNSANTSVAVSSEILRGCRIDINASGLRSANGGSNARCIYSTGSNRVTTRDTNCFITGTDCVGATLFGCETTVSGSYMDLQSSTISASGTLLTNCSVAEISQTHDKSIITLGYTNLLYHSANGKGFDVTQTLANYIFGFFSSNNITSGTGTNGIGGSNFYLLSGTMPFQTIVDNSTSSAVPYTVAQDGIMHDIIFRANNTANFSTNILHMNLFINNITTPVFTTSLTGSTRLATSPNTSFTVKTNDTIYINISFSSNSATLTDFRSCSVDFGLL